MEPHGRERGQVSATFSDLESARAAMAALERAGVDGSTISLGGEAERVLHRSPNVQQRDSGVMRELAKWSVTGAVVGLVIGALAGAVIGYLLFGVDDRGFLVTVIGMAGVGLAIGGLVTPISALPTTPQYDRTFQEDVPGTVRLTVHSQDQDTLQKVADVLAHAKGADANRSAGHGDRGRQRA